MHKVQILLFLIISNCFLTYAQENISWYSYGMQGDKTKITEHKDFLIYEEVKEAESPYPARLDTIYISKRINDSIYIVDNRRGKEAFALMVNSTIEKGAIKSVGIYYPSNQINEVETQYTTKGLPLWKDLVVRWVFSEAKTKELDNAPGYDEVTREAIIAALGIRAKLSKPITAYIEDNPKTQPFRMYRFVEQAGHHKFISLGYNPYKPVPYNFEKQFEGDVEVLKLLTEPMSFEQ